MDVVHPFYIHLQDSIAHYAQKFTMKSKKKSLEVVDVSRLFKWIAKPIQRLHLCDMLCKMPFQIPPVL